MAARDRAKPGSAVKFIFKLVHEKAELVDFKKDILALFRDCFGKGLEEDIWRWAYLDNTMGGPIVSLCFAEGKLVGHYAVIPIALKRKNAQIRTCLAMTVMVERSFRKYALFIHQAEQVHDRAKELGFQLAVGFPNKQSSPGFRKRLGWNLGPIDYVACVTKEQLMRCRGLRDYLRREDCVGLDMGEDKFLNWRLSKPGQEYRVQEGLVTRHFNGNHAIVYMDQRYEQSLDPEKKFNVLLDASLDELKQQMIFEYQFGYKILDEKLKELFFKKDLLMSDVF